MFDISFTELLVIGVIALIVIGPERLPKVARTAGQWVGKLNRFVSQVKQDIDRDIRLDELRKMQQEMKDSAQKYEIMANDTLHRVEDTVAEETGQISKVMQAMGTTDGGLSMREYEKLKAEESATAETGQAAKVEAVPEAVSSDSPVTSGQRTDSGTKPDADKAQA
ncbi:MAG: twin-arginine translocase subunit TatB [Thiobacillus sp.]|nr:twin-arginine translocase subunit TatB [Thiobacillus sp.]